MKTPTLTVQVRVLIVMWPEMLCGARLLVASPCCCCWASPEPYGNPLLARAELRSWRSSDDVVSIGEMDSAPPPASRASLDVVVNELPMDVNVALYLHTESP